MKVIKLLLLSLITLLIGSCITTRNDIKNIDALTAKSTYRLVSSSGHGSAVAVKAPSGKVYLISNMHVCINSINRMMFAVNYENKSELVKVVHISYDTDLCLLSAPKDAVAITKSKRTIYQNDKVYAVGYMNRAGFRQARDGYIIRTGNGTLNLGANFSGCGKGKTFKISYTIATGQQAEICLLNINSYVLNMSIAPGVSGGPLVDEYGQLIGIMYGTENNITAMAIPLTNVKKYIKNR